MLRSSGEVEHDDEFQNHRLLYAYVCMCNEDYGAAPGNFFSLQQACSRSDE
jgi:hypothetical protein